ncbi:glutamic acid-rich protein [Haplochromis burtoni]|uniref:glutamic acid-rich protein n=1 Tax=Haplochromis burtoni TaxID=8153 RepID=UPI001C2D8E2F|nr:glutamic acid-rich protein [Haplochromis burtoni]
MQEELERRQADQLKEKQRLEDERETKQSGLNNMQEESLVRRSKPHLNYFESEDWPQESKSPHSPSPNTSGPTENLMDVVYDDFSVKQNPINIEFDDFSVKPIKVLSRRKTESNPVFRSWDDFLDIEEVKGLVPVDVKTERAKEDKMEKPEQCPNTPPLQEREWVEEIKDEPEEEQLISLDVKKEEQLISLDVKKEEQLISLDVKKEEQLISLDVEEEEKHISVDVKKEEQLISLDMKKEEKHISVDVKKEEQLISLDVEEEEEEKETETEDEDEMEEDNQEDQTNSFSTKNEDKDTDALIDFGLNHDQQDPVWEQTPERNSPQPVPDEVPEVSSEDTADDLKEPEFAPFPESSTPLLDTSAQRSKADLGKRRIRTRPSRRLTAGLAQTETQDWGTQDSTVEKETVAKERESDSEEEQPKPKVVCSPSQRVPVFPGMSPAGLLAQLKRKTGGGGTAVKEETVESKASEEKEHQDEEVAPSSVELSHSPRTPARLAGATRVLPLIGNKEEGGASSPAWLKELKSKKRMSQHGSDA